VFPFYFSFANQRFCYHKIIGCDFRSIPAEWLLSGHHQPVELVHRKKPRGSRADRRYDEQIVVAFEEKLPLGLPSREVAGPSMGWAYLFSEIDCFTREVVS
jgi:hypothetical protein